MRPAVVLYFHLFPSKICFLKCPFIVGVIKTSPYYILWSREATIVSPQHWGSVCSLFVGKLLCPMGLHWVTGWGRMLVTPALADLVTISIVMLFLLYLVLKFYHAVNCTQDSLLIASAPCILTSFLKTWFYAVIDPVFSLVVVCCEIYCLLLSLAVNTRQADPLGCTPWSMLGDFLAASKEFVKLLGEMDVGAVWPVIDVPRWCGGHWSGSCGSYILHFVINTVTWQSFNIYGFMYLFLYSLFYYLKKNHWGSAMRYLIQLVIFTLGSTFTID